MTKVVVVDNLFEGQGKLAGAMRRVGSGQKQSITVRCPSCARSARFPIHPNGTDSGFTWHADMGRIGINISPTMVFPCGWTGQVVEGLFVESTADAA